MLTPSRPTVRLTLLGPPVVTCGDAPSPLLTGPRRLAVLAYMACARPRGLHSRETLIALFWPEGDTASGRHALRNVLHAIRSALGEHVVQAAGDGMVGLNAAHIDCDIGALEADLAENRVEAALDRDPREFLRGFHISGAPAYERWVDIERRRLVVATLDAAWSTVAALARAGDDASVLRVTRKAFELAPDDERWLRRLLEAYATAGDRASAGQAYEAFAEHMAREYDAQLSTETQALMAHIRGSRPPAPVAPRDPQPTISIRPTTDAEAWILYVRGTYLFLRAAPVGDARELERSRAFFEEAIERDPQFAHAWAGLSNFYAVAAVRNVIRPFDATFARAIELSHHTLALDPTLAIPHVHFGVKAMYLDGDWETAGTEFARAVALDPSYAEAHKFNGIYLSAMGRTREAMQAFKEAVRVEPHIALFRNAIAAEHMALGAYEAAVDELRQALALDASYGAARERLIRCYERLDRYEEAVRERRHGNPAAAEPFAMAFEREGAAGYRHARDAELRAMIQSVAGRLSDGPPENAAEILNPPQLRLALACAELGDRDGALAWEEHACSRRPGQRQWFKSHPELAWVHASQ